MPADLDGDVAELLDLARAGEVEGMRGVLARITGRSQLARPLPGDG